jgi:protein phosphatase
MPFSPGSWIDDRYFVVGERIVLDTRPRQLPAFPQELPEAIIPYLHLIPHRLAVPQVYGSLSAQFPNVFLLEEAPIHGHATGITSGMAAPTPEPGTLMPQLLEQWPQASPQRQLAWLWQMVQLWEPFEREEVAWSLLQPDLLRVDGTVLRLLELEQRKGVSDLREMGRLWATWIPQAHPHLQPFLEGMTERVKKGKIAGISSLLRLLEQVLVQVSQTQQYRIQVVARTDQGPHRKNNEDACFPVSIEPLTTTEGLESLVIVCDGLGGHEGGEVAAGMTVKTLQEELQANLSQDSTFLPRALEKAITIANDRISLKNNRENRQNRRRMGTTLVTALMVKPFLHLAHIGDSRAYWITRSGCRQVTLDDDLACRHVRLGFGLYRAVLKNPNSGALIQAIGMAPSENLMPNIQKLFLDEEGLFLLCSDGLSDYDLVEAIWSEEIAPILDQPLDQSQTLKQVADRFIQLANDLNGHDNVTVALFHYQITQPDSSSFDLDLQNLDLKKLDLQKLLATLETETLPLVLASDQSTSSTTSVKSSPFGTSSQDQTDNLVPEPIMESTHDTSARHSSELQSNSRQLYADDRHSPTWVHFLLVLVTILGIVAGVLFLLKAYFSPSSAPEPNSPGSGYSRKSG